MKKFDYSFLENCLLPSNLMDLSCGVSELKILENVRKKEYKEIFTKLESVAKVQSVKGSNAIEGIITTDKRILEIVNKSSAPLNHNEAEIAGYRDVLNLIHEGFEYINITENTILKFHDTLLSYTNYAERGKYKTIDNVIMELDKERNRRVRFVPVPAEETKLAMEQMISAYADARGNSSISQLLLIPCFILDFLCIHPFSDGNGRMSRLLSLLLLYKSGFDAGKYISFEEQINKNRSSYYESLKESSKEWTQNENTYFPFIENFITTLLMCYKELDSRFTLVAENKINKKLRIEAVILNSLLPVSKQNIGSVLPDVSFSTIEAVLADLIKSGKIKKIGGFKDAKYIKQE